MMFVKIMSSQNLSDTDPGKRFTLISVGDKEQIQFKMSNWIDETLNRMELVIVREDGEQEHFEMDGNIYIMNAQGKTIASHSPAPIGPSPCIGEISAPMPLQGTPA